MYLLPKLDQQQSTTYWKTRIETKFKALFNSIQINLDILRLKIGQLLKIGLHLSLRIRIMLVWNLREKQLQTNSQPPHPKWQEQLIILRAGIKVPYKSTTIKCLEALDRPFKINQSKIFMKNFRGRGSFLSGATYLVNRWIHIFHLFY